MKKNAPTLNILLPVYNEEKRLENGVRKADAYLDGQKDIPYVLTIVDNASTDRTEMIARSLCGEMDHVRYIKVSEKGVGAAFREGIKNNSCDYVGYMDIDLSTDLHHLREMYDIFCGNENVDLVNGSRWNRASHTAGRKWYRNLTSFGLVCVLKASFGMKATDAICGFKFYKKAVAERLIRQTFPDNGWFFIIEMLIRAEKSGMNIHELPVVWNDDKDNSTVHAVRQTMDYLRKIAALKKRLRAVPVGEN